MKTWWQSVKANTAGMRECGSVGNRANAQQWWQSVSENVVAKCVSKHCRDA